MPLFHSAPSDEAESSPELPTRRRTRDRWSAAAVAVLAVVAGAGTLLLDLTDQQTVDIAETPSASVAPGTSLPGLPTFPVTLDLPPEGEVAAAHLGERPVFVIHRDGGEVLVLDAISPHTGSFTKHPKVVAFCRDPWIFETRDERTVVETPGTFADLWHGSLFALDGAWLGGPAPTGLPGYEVLAAADDIVEVGPPVAAPEREVGPFADRLGPRSDTNARPVASAAAGCTTEFDQARSETPPADQTTVLWHQSEYPDRWTYPFASDGEQTSAQDTIEPLAEGEQPTAQQPARQVPPPLLVALAVLATTAAVGIHLRRRRN